MENKTTLNEIQYIPLEYVKPNPYQPRTHFNESALQELAISIENYGVLQPINVRKFSETSYELIAGERRLRAAKLANLTKIPAIISEIADIDSAMLALIENLQRENLNFIEEAESFEQLIKFHGLTQEQIAKKIGKNQSTVANKLRLLKLKDNVKEIVVSNKLSERHARALLRLPEDELQIEALNKIIEKKLNVKKSEELIEKIRNEVLINNHDEKLKKTSRARIKSFINLRIYTNTLKNAFSEIKKTGIDATYEEKDYQDYLEVKVRIPKKK